VLVAVFCEVVVVVVVEGVGLCLAFRVREGRVVVVFRRYQPSVTSKYEMVWVPLISN